MSQPARNVKLQMVLLTSIVLTGFREMTVWRAWRRSGKLFTGGFLKRTISCGRVMV